MLSSNSLSKMQQYSPKRSYIPKLLHTVNNSIFVTFLLIVFSQEPFCYFFNGLEISIKFCVF
jgi:hypothetical protein